MALEVRTLHDVWSQEPSASDYAIDCIVMEYLDGQTLAPRWMPTLAR